MLQVPQEMDTVYEAPITEDFTDDECDSALHDVDTKQILRDEADEIRRREEAREAEPMTDDEANDRADAADSDSDLDDARARTRTATTGSGSTAEQPDAASVNSLEYTDDDEAARADKLRDRDADADEKDDARHDPSRYEGENPFEYDTPPTAYELAKLLFFAASLLAVLRAALFMCVMLSVAALTSLATIGLDPRTAYERPYARWRQVVLVPVAPLCRLAMLVLGFWHVTVRGTPDPRAAFLTPNHVSLFDAMALYWLARPAAVAKAELFNKPLLGRILRGLQVIPLQRESHAAREETKRLLANFAQSRANPDPTLRFPPVLIFPQGTCTKDGFVSMFQRGAFLPGLPVQPVALRYPHRHFNPAYVCTRRKDYFFRRHLTQWSMSLEVTFLPLHVPTEAEKVDATLFANAVRQEIADALGAATTDHFFDDCKLFQAALDEREELHVLRPLQKRRPIDDVRLRGLHLKEIKDVFGGGGSRLAEIKHALRVFREFDRDDDGTISYEEFCTATGGPPDADATRALFDFCDRDGSGAVDFRELVLAMALASPSASSADKTRLAFRLADRDGDGALTTSDLRGLLQAAAGGAFADAAAVDQEMARISDMARVLGAQSDAEDGLRVSWEVFRRLARERPALVDSAIATYKFKALPELGDSSKQD